MKMMVKRLPAVADIGAVVAVAVVGCLLYKLEIIPAWAIPLVVLGGIVVVVAVVAAFSRCEDMGGASM